MHYLFPSNSTNMQYHIIMSLFMAGVFRKCHHHIIRRTANSQNLRQAKSCNNCSANCDPLTGSRNEIHLSSSSSYGLSNLNFVWLQAELTLVYDYPHQDVTLYQVTHAFKFSPNLDRLTPHELLPVTTLITILNLLGLYYIPAYRRLQGIFLPKAGFTLCKVENPIIFNKLPLHLVMSLFLSKLYVLSTYVSGRPLLQVPS